MICGNDDSDKNGCFVGMLVGEMLGMMEKRVYELAEISMNIDASDTNNTRLETLYLASNELNRMLENPTLQNKEKGTQELDFVSIIHNYRGFLLDQLGEVARSASTTSVSNAAEASGSADLVANSKMLKGVVNFAKFEDNTYSDIINQLTNHANSMQQGSVEGGIFMSHGSGKSISNWLERRKRECILLETFHSYESETAARPFAIGEIGFNAGHSSAMFLSVFPEVSVHSFDICRHMYTEPAAASLRQHFDGRLALTCGDSIDTLGRMNEEGAKIFDFFFVDGYHTKAHALADIINGCGVTKSGATIVVDDCLDAPVRLAWEEAVEMGVVTPKHHGMCWENICIGRCSPK